MISRNCVEDQRPFLPLGQLLADFGQARELAAVPRPVLAVAGELAGMIARLLQPHQRPQHDAAPRDSFDLLEVASHGLHDALVERHLLAGQMAVARRLGLVRQVGDDAAVRLQTPQNVRPYQPAQRRGTAAPRAPAVP